MILVNLKWNFLTKNLFFFKKVTGYIILNIFYLKQSTKTKSLIHSFFRRFLINMKKAKAREKLVLLQIIDLQIMNTRLIWTQNFINEEVRSHWSINNGHGKPTWKIEQKLLAWSVEWIQILLYLSDYTTLNLLAHYLLPVCHRMSWRCLMWSLKYSSHFFQDSPLLGVQCLGGY